jgi:hypothetical protein
VSHQRLGAEGVVGVAVVAVVGMLVGAAVAVAVVEAVGVVLRMSVGMVGVEVPACGRRGAGGADANLTEQARIDITSFDAAACHVGRDPMHLVAADFQCRDKGLNG